MTSAPGPGAPKEPPRAEWPEEDLAQARGAPPVNPAADGAVVTGPDVGTGSTVVTGSTQPPPATPAVEARPGPGSLRRALGAVGHAAGTPMRLLRRRFPWMNMHSRRGKLLVVFLVAGFASVLTVGGVIAVQWTETADFCGRCHTMGPELKAHSISPHRELACAECHVEPGVEGWVKAKLNGTRQLVQLITGTFPTPIPPPGHGDLPPTSQTCRRCHDADALVTNGPVELILKTRFDDDEKNSRSSVAMVLRPAGFGTDSRGVHWHIDLDVEYSSTDRRAQQIEVVTVTDKIGITTKYVANREVTRADRVQADIDRLTAANPLQRMDCIDCHNRIGHRVPSLEEAIDSAMAGGRVDPGLPFIKQQAVATLSENYANSAGAETAIDNIRAFYQSRYPLVVSQKPVTLQGAVDQLKVIYNLVATPEMKVSASTYPDNLGHKNYPGCFRCHDGAHFKVANGQLTKEAIPSTCATCHTFPQVGSTVGASSFLIGERPDTHRDRFWLFSHKTLAGTDAGKNTCAACHTQTYCQNCHSSSAINVPHDDMLYNHPAVIQRLGGMTNCALCHQPTSCEKCHPRGVPGFSSAAQTFAPN